MWLRRLRDELENNIQWAAVVSDTGLEYAGCQRPKRTSSMPTSLMHS